MKCAQWTTLSFGFKQRVRREDSFGYFCNHWFMLTERGNVAELNMKCSFSKNSLAHEQYAPGWATLQQNSALLIWASPLLHPHRCLNMHCLPQLQGLFDHLYLRLDYKSVPSGCKYTKLEMTCNLRMFMFSVPARVKCSIYIRLKMAPLKCRSNDCQCAHNSLSL